MCAPQFSPKRSHLQPSFGCLPGMLQGVGRGLRARGLRLDGAHVAAFGVPVFDQGQGRIGVRQAALQAALEEHAALLVEVRAKARALGGRLRTARERAVFLRDVVVPLRERILEQAVLLHNAMTLSVFELLQDRQQVLRAELELVDALLIYWLARAFLEQRLDGRLPRGAGGLDEVGVRR